MGRIYAIGGLEANDAQGPTLSGVVEGYDPVDDSWTTEPSLVATRALGGIALDTRGAPVVLWGLGSTGALATVETIDPATSQWVEHDGGPPGRFDVACTATAAGLIYLIGGRVDGRPTADVDILDSTTGTWSLGSSLPESRASGGAATDDRGRIYLVGGQQLGEMPTVYAHDPGAAGWTELSPLPRPRSAPVVFGSDGRLYALGGTTIPWTTLASVAVYDPRRDAWVESD
jgi:N-acetylneuraminic acid mutarotase